MYHDKNRTILKRFAWIFFTSFVIFTVLVLISKDYERNLVKNDFSAFYTGAKLYVAGEPKDMYNLEKQLEVQKELPYYVESHDAPNKIMAFVTPPASVLPFIPFVYIPGINAYKAFVVFDGFLLIILMILITRTVRNVPIPLVATPYFAPAQWFIHFSQIALFLPFCHVLSYGFMQRKKYFWAGFCLGFLLLKPQALAVVPFLLILAGNKKSFLKGLLLSLAGIFILNMFLYKGLFWDSYLTYINNLGLYQSDGNLLREHTLFGLLTHLLNFDKTLELRVGFFATIVAYLTALWFVYIKNRQGTELWQLFTASIVFSLFLNAHTMYVDLVYLIFPMALYAVHVFGKFKKISILKVFTFYLFMVLPNFSLFRAEYIAAVGFLLFGVLVTYMNFGSNEFEA